MHTCSQACQLPRRSHRTKPLNSPLAASQPAKRVPLWPTTPSAGFKSSSLVASQSHGPGPSYVSSSAGFQYWQAEATLQIPDLSEPLEATEYGSSKQRAKAAAAQALLEQLEEHGFSTTGPGTGPNPYQNQLRDLLSHERLGVLIIATYTPRMVGAGGNAPLWETEVLLTDFSSGSYAPILCKAVMSTGSKAAAKEAAAKALLEDPELYEVLEDIREGELASGNITLQLVQAALSETNDAGPPSKRRRVTSEA